MDLKGVLSALVNVAPPDATVPVRWLAELLATEPATVQPDSSGSLSVDLTVEQVARRFGKGTSTIRTWLARGELEGAYRLHGREWRIPESAVEALQRIQSRQHTQRSTQPLKRPQDVNLSEWRKHTTRTTRPTAATGKGRDSTHVALLGG